MQVLQGRATGSPEGGAIAFPQTDAIWRGVLCLRKMVSAMWAGTQHRYPGGCHRATTSSLSSCNSSLLHPHPAGFQGEWLQMRFYALVFREHLCLHQTPVSPWLTESPLLFTVRCYMGTSCGLWCPDAGEPGMGLRPLASQGKPPQLRDIPMESQLPPMGTGQGFSHLYPS